VAKELYQVDMTFCCIGVEVINGVIKDIAPILKCWKGSKWERFYDYYNRRNKIIKVRKVERHEDTRRKRRSGRGNEQAVD